MAVRRQVPTGQYSPPPPPPTYEKPPPAYAPPGYGAPPLHTGPPCPRCYSTLTKKGEIPVWAIVLAVLLCPVGLLFLLVHDENHCFQCGMRWKV